MKSKLLLIIGLVLLFVVPVFGSLLVYVQIPSHGIVSSTTPSLSRLHVDGAWLKDSSGRKVQLRGVVSDAMVDVPHYYGSWDTVDSVTGLTMLEKFCKRIKEAGANVLAVGFWYGWFLDRDTDDTNWGWQGRKQYEHFLFCLDNYVNAAVKFDLYLRANDHNCSGRMGILP
jgi:hypothetical protein